jgi:hypothetical protein
VKSRSVLVLAGCLSLAACQSLSMPKFWPFYKKPKPPPEVVNEVTLVMPDGSPANFPQYWQRNTLIIDLTSVSGQGSVAARLPEERAWPVRLALRVRPGSVGQLDVRGEERNVLPIATEGLRPIDIELSPSLYAPTTAAIYIAWAPLAPIVENAPVKEEPAFVSPTEVPRPAEETPSARDIMPPGEVAPPGEAAPQPSPPPGS